MIYKYRVEANNRILIRTNNLKQANKEFNAMLKEEASAYVALIANAE